MNIVSLFAGQPVTTSAAIADGTGVQHKNVLDLVRTYKSDLESFGGVAFETRPFDTEGGEQKREVALLNEPQATLVMTYMRNSDIVRAFKIRLVKAFWEMTTQIRQPAIPQDLPSALRLLADQVERTNAAESQLAVAQPLVAALNRIATATDGAVCLRVAAKIAQVPEKQFLAFLHEAGWIFRHHHSQTWQGYSDKEKAGLLELKRTKVTRDDLSEKTVEQVLITPRGQAKVAELIERKAPWLRKTTNAPSTGASPQ